VSAGVVVVDDGGSGSDADMGGGDGADDGGTSPLFDCSSGTEEGEGRRVCKYSSMLWTYASVTRVGAVSSVSSVSSGGSVGRAMVVGCDLMSDSDSDSVCLTFSVDCLHSKVTAAAFNGGGEDEDCGGKV
jgi:hypothetical protein